MFFEPDDASDDERGSVLPRHRLEEPDPLALPLLLLLLGLSHVDTVRMCTFASFVSKNVFAQKPSELRNGKEEGRRSAVGRHR